MLWLTQGSRIQSVCELVADLANETQSILDTVVDESQTTRRTNASTKIPECSVEQGVLSPGLRGHKKTLEQRATKVVQLGCAEENRATVALAVELSIENAKGTVV